MEACALGLFLLARNEDGSLACIGQAIITAAILGATVLFQVFLSRAVTAPIQHLSLIPADDPTTPSSTLLRRLLIILGFCDSPVNVAAAIAYKKRWTQNTHQTAFEHEALREGKPVVWIPRDHFGFSEDAIVEARSRYEDLLMNNEGAKLDEKGNLTVEGGPPTAQ